MVPFQSAVAFASLSALTQASPLHQATSSFTSIIPSVTVHSAASRTSLGFSTVTVAVLPTELTQPGPVIMDFPDLEAKPTTNSSSIVHARAHMDRPLDDEITRGVDVITTPGPERPVINHLNKHSDEDNLQKNGDTFQLTERGNPQKSGNHIAARAHKGIEEMDDRWISIINATPYRWIKGFTHNYNVDSWVGWPDVIEPGAKKTLLAMSRHGIIPQHSAAEVAYHLEGTEKPASFMIEYRNGEDHVVWVKFLEELATVNNGKLSEHRLGNYRRPGGVGFVLAGKEGHFTSIDPPLDWMQSQLPEIGKLPLRHIIMPRSHHSGMWKAEHRVNFAQPRNTKTQSLRLYDQLGEGGVRVLDVRPVKTKKGFHEIHGSRIVNVYNGFWGASFDEMVKEVNKFNREVPGELIIWDIHPTDGVDSERNYKRLDQAGRAAMYESLKGLEHRANVSDSEDITQWPLEKFIGNGTSAVLIRIDESWLIGDTEGNFPGGKEGFVTSRNFPANHRWSETDKVKTMVKDQLDYIHTQRPSRDARIFISDWLMTQLGAGVPFPVDSIEEMGFEPWLALYDNLWEGVDDQSYPNWISVDSVHGNQQKALVMAMNHCLVARKCGSLGGKVKGVAKD